MRVYCLNKSSCRDIKVFILKLRTKEGKKEEVVRAVGGRGAGTEGH